MNTTEANVVEENAASSPAETVPGVPAPATQRRGLFAPIKFLWGMLFCQSAIGGVAIVGWTFRFMQRAVFKQWHRAAATSGGGEVSANFTEAVAAAPATEEHVHWPNWFLRQNFRYAIRGAQRPPILNAHRDEAVCDSPHPPFGHPLPTGEGLQSGADTESSEGQQAHVTSPSPGGEGRGEGEPLLQRRAEPGLMSRTLYFCRSLGASLWLNVKLGVQGILNVWLLTLPGCALMAFGWYDGWQNSFNKGYEQASVGAVISLAGIALLIAAMLYVPMAQARQAVTGNWRCFYQFRLIWGLIRRRWLANLGITLLYCLVSIPVTVLAIAPQFFSQINPKLADLGPEEVKQVLNSYYFWCAALVFPAFVGLRWIAARNYGSTLLKAVQSGALAVDELGEREWEILNRWNLLAIKPQPDRHVVIKVVAWAGTRAGRITFGILTAIVWFIFIGQLYIAQFFNYRQAIAWLNQPLIQLPWFHHMPQSVANPWGEVFATALLFLVVWWVYRLGRGIGAGLLTRQRGA